MGLRFCRVSLCRQQWNGNLTASRNEIRRPTIKAFEIAQVSSYSMWGASQSVVRRNRSLFAILFPGAMQLNSGKVRGNFPAREVR
jgi:hypothetical protein